MSQLKSLRGGGKMREGGENQLTLLQPPDLTCLSKYKVSKHSNLLCIWRHLLEFPASSSLGYLFCLCASKFILNDGTQYNSEKTLS